MYQSRIPAIAAALAPTIDRALKAGAELIAEDARARLAPHRLSGELGREIHVDDRQRTGIYVMAGDPSDPAFAFYGFLLEFGTSHAPAFEDKRETVLGMADLAMKGLL